MTDDVIWYDGMVSCDDVACYDCMLDIVMRCDVMIRLIWLRGDAMYMYAMVKVPVSLAY